MNKKRIIMIVAAIAAATMAMAQVTIEERADKGWNRVEQHFATVLGERDGMTIVLTSYTKTPAVYSDMTSGIKLKGIGADGKVAKELTVSKERNSRTVAATMDGDHVYILGYGYEKKADYWDLYRIVIDLNSWTREGEAELVHKHTEKKMTDIDWKVAATPDGSVTAVGVCEIREHVKFAGIWGKKDTESNHLLVFDKQYKPLWERKNVEGFYNNMVMDENEVCHVMLAGRGKGKTYFMFATHSSYSDNAIIDSIDHDDIESVRLLNWIDGTYVVAGLTSSGSIIVDGTQYDGMFAMAYNEKSQTMKFKKRSLGDNEINVLANREYDAAMKKGKVNALQLKDGIATEWGGVLHVWRAYIEEVLRNGARSLTWQMTGSMLCGVDTNAEFRWVAPIRNRLVSMEAQFDLGQPVFREAGATYVVQCESGRYAQTYENSNAIKMLYITEPSQLAIYRIDDGGAVEKTVFPQDKATVIRGQGHKAGGSRYVTIGKAKGGKLVKLKGL